MDLFALPQISEQKKSQRTSSMSESLINTNNRQSNTSSTINKSNLTNTSAGAMMNGIHGGFRCTLGDNLNKNGESPEAELRF